MTKAEVYLWQVLRRDVLGVRFRRQMPVGPYFADFACIPAKLIIEVDGRTHREPEARVRDRARQLWLEQQGWHVLRFDDDIIIGGSKLVLEAIKIAVEEGLSG